MKSEVSSLNSKFSNYHVVVSDILNKVLWLEYLPSSHCPSYRGALSNLILIGRPGYWPVPKNLSDPFWSEQLRHFFVQLHPKRYVRTESTKTWSVPSHPWLTLDLTNVLRHKFLNCFPSLSWHKSLVWPTIWWILSKSSFDIFSFSDESSKYCSARVAADNSSL